MRLSGLHAGQQTAVKRLLRDLVRNGKLAKDGKRFTLGQPRPAAREARGSKSGSAGGAVIEGLLSLHRDGFGFVGDVFVPPPEAAKALDGDRVRIRKVPSGRGRFEGRIVEVIDRRREQSVGTYQEEAGRAWVDAHDPAMPRIHVPPTQLARSGDVVKVRLGVAADLLGRQGLSGEVSGSLGRPGDPSQEVLSVVFAKGFSDEFPPEVMDEADRIPSQVAVADGRRDLRELPLVTIDGIDARDFDDAVHAEALPTGGWRLWVAIADVSHYVRPGSPLDAEARARGTSVYLPDRVLPMLPERLSNGICSLKPDEDRLCMVAELEVGPDGETRRTKLYPAIMRSAARCTYEEVQEVLNGNAAPHRERFRTEFETLASLARALNKMRAARGAIDFDLPEHKVKVGEDGKPAAIERRERLESHRLIEACMLAANEAVARFFHERAVPTVYRFHAEPDPDKLATFTALAEAYGFYLEGGQDGRDSKVLNAFMKKLAGHPEQRALNQLLLRSMMQAIYSAENVGHYGLAAEHYLHFTSPIRRYPDLLVHRLLKELWQGGHRRGPAQAESSLERLEVLATHCSERERAAVQAEREVVAFYSALLMQGRVGEEFDGIVASLTDFGFFVELADPIVEGLVKSTSLGHGARFDARRHAIVLPSGRVVRVGQSLRVRLAAVNLERRQLELEVVRFSDSETREEPSSLGRPAPAGRPGRPGPGRPAVRERPRRQPQRGAGGGDSPHPGFDRLRTLAAQTPGSPKVRSSTRPPPKRGAPRRRR